MTRGRARAQTSATTARGEEGQGHEALLRRAPGIAHGDARDGVQDDGHRRGRSERRCLAARLRGSSASPSRARRATRFAFAATRSPRRNRNASPTGLVVLQGEDKVRPVDRRRGARVGGSEARRRPATCSSSRSTSASPTGTAKSRVGRFVLATGAILPVQIDGAEVIARAPWGSTLEAFGGAPVVPRFGARAYDWLVGRARRADRRLDTVTLGVSYVQRREDGEISNEEVGADLAAAPARWLDLAANGAYDLTSPGHRGRAGLGGGAGSTRFASSSSRRSNRPGGCFPRRRSSRCWATSRRRRSAAP